MKPQRISLQLLADYIKDEEVGYQVIDELINIARGGEHQRTKFLLDEVAKSSEALLIENHKDIIMGYEAIMEWSEPTDTLICLDRRVMLLFPKHIDESFPTISKILPTMFV